MIFGGCIEKFSVWFCWDSYQNISGRGTVQGAVIPPARHCCGLDRSRHLAGAIVLMEYLENRSLSVLITEINRKQIFSLLFLPLFSTRTFGCCSPWAVWATDMTVLQGFLCPASLEMFLNDNLAECEYAHPFLKFLIFKVPALKKYLWNHLSDSKSGIRKDKIWAILIQMLICWFRTKACSFSSLKKKARKVWFHCH